MWYVSTARNGASPTGKVNDDERILTSCIQSRRRTSDHTEQRREHLVANLDKVLLTTSSAQPSWINFVSFRSVNE